ncbi:MAG: hypothetical protein O2895_05875 [Chloroflexi bacterium]|nr:hypothetical protein [Chloroflexota bacterium]
MTTIENCTFGGGFLRSGCGREAVTDCVYCGRPFCAEHGERAAQYMDVCARKGCHNKLRDLEAHDAWKARVADANRVSVCAQEDCSARLHHQCSRCHLLFCGEHVREMRVRDTTRMPAMEVRGLVCEHCAQRRKLWR